MAAISDAARASALDLVEETLQVQEEEARWVASSATKVVHLMAFHWVQVGVVEPAQVGVAVEGLGKLLLQVQVAHQILGFATRMVH